MLVTTLVHKSPARERANAWTADRSQDMSYSSYNVVAVQLLSLQLRLKKRHLRKWLLEFFTGCREPQQTQGLRRKTYTPHC